MCTINGMTISALPCSFRFQSNTATYIRNFIFYLDNMFRLSSGLHKTWNKRFVVLCYLRYMHPVLSFVKMT